AVLRNYERWPEHFGKDVDLVVDPNDLALSHGIIRRLAADFGLSFTVRRKRSSHVTYYLVGTPGEDALILDLRPDVVHHGLVYLPGTLVLASRRRHADGFYVPSPALESLAILLHAVIDAGTVGPSVGPPRDPRRAGRLGEDHVGGAPLQAVRGDAHPGFRGVPRRAGAAAPHPAAEPAAPQAALDGPQGEGGQGRHAPAAPARPRPHHGGQVAPLHRVRPPAP